MKEYIDVLRRTKLFSGVVENEIEAMLSCLDARIRNYKKGEYIIRQGQRISDIAVLVKGSLHIRTDDYWGNRSILGDISVGEMFGEAYISPQSSVSLNDVAALEDSTVIFFDVKKIITTCSSACVFHSVVVQNMFFAVCDKNRKLVQKLGHISLRSTREKLISYLSEQSKQHASAEFTIPFNRQQLADFLSVDRSAMSNELCKMRDEGMIEFEKSRFKLCDCIKKE